MTNFSMTTDVKKQHTVPRFLLNNFSHGARKTKQLHTFDMINNRVFVQSELDATTRRHFYNFDANVEGASLEPMLGVIENDAAPIFESIISNQCLKHLTKEQRDVISVFIIVQRARTFGSLQQFKEMSEVIFSKVDAEHYEVRNDYLTLLVNQMKLTPYILNKDWVLYSTGSEHPFYISDNPVVFHNHNKSSSRGNLGLGVEGIQIHMPLTPTLSIAFLCPTVSGMFLNAANQIRELTKRDPNIMSHLENPSAIMEAALHIEHGTPHKLEKVNVDFQNSLQVSFAERFLFSVTNDFSFAKEIVSENKNGQKPSSRFQ